MKTVNFAFLILIFVFCASAGAQGMIPKENPEKEYGWVLMFEGEYAGDWDPNNKEKYDGKKIILWFERKDRATLNSDKYIWEIVNLSSGKSEKWEQEVTGTVNKIYDQFELAKGRYICLVKDAVSGAVVGRSLKFKVK